MVYSVLLFEIILFCEKINISIKQVRTGPIWRIKL
jgi:hypothetical protein